MSLLLDTHIVLWWLTDDVTLADDIKARLDHEPDVFVSAATIWASGKIRPFTPKAELPRMSEATRVTA